MSDEPAPIPMLLWCPMCGTRHVDQGAMEQRAHKTHACQKCGLNWKPALVPTVGVQFLPGCKDSQFDSEPTHPPCSSEECEYCTGDDCYKCGPEDSMHCGHDVIERHNED